MPASAAGQRPFKGLSRNAGDGPLFCADPYVWWISAPGTQIGASTVMARRSESARRVGQDPRLVLDIDRSPTVWPEHEADVTISGHSAGKVPQAM